jgi:DNA adenine methylase
VLCTSIYGYPIKCDFILYHPELWQECLVIESKWQQSGGSADEKFPYTVFNLKEQSPVQSIIVVDGDGQNKGAVAWLRGQVDKKKLLHVLSMAEFQNWVNKGNI